MQQGFSGCESVAILSFLSLLSELFELLDFEFPCAGATGIPIGRLGMHTKVGLYTSTLRVHTGQAV
jgi:hypothetical protein